MLKDFSFAKLMAHTFPGFVLVLGVLFIADFFFPTSIIFSMFANFENLTAFVGAFVLIGTIAGVVIDSVQHSEIICGLISKIADWRNPPERGKDGERTHPARESWKVLVKHIDSKSPEGARLEDLKIKHPHCFYAMPFVNLEVYRHLLDDYYYYSEFYVNLALALPFLAVGSLSFVGHRMIDIGDGLFFYSIVGLILLFVVVVSVGLIKLSEATEKEFWQHFVELVAGSLILKSQSEDSNKKKQEVQESVAEEEETDAGRKEGKR